MKGNWLVIEVVTGDFPFISAVEERKALGSLSWHHADVLMGGP